MQSETIGKLAEALAKAQGAMDNPARSAENPFFKSKYAPLSAITDAIRKPLSQNGLSYVQTVSMQNDIVTLTTRLMHMSGEWVESAMPLPHVGKPQELGSVMTYFRRYQLSAIVGITADDDDDGNEAGGNRAQSAQRQPAKSAPPSNGNGKHAASHAADNPFDDDLPAEVKLWKSPMDAQAWAIECGASDNEHSARAAFKNAVDAHGGKLKADNMTQVFVTYYHERMKRAAEKGQDAIADVTLANVPEMAH